MKGFNLYEQYFYQFRLPGEGSGCFGLMTNPHELKKNGDNP